MNIEQNLFKLPTAASPDPEPTEPYTEAGQRPADEETDEIADSEQWIVDAQDFLFALKKENGSREGLKKEKERIADFMKPYLDGKLSFSSFIRNPRTAPLALEIARKIFSRSIDNHDTTELFLDCSKCGQEMAGGANFCSACGGKIEKKSSSDGYLYHEIAASLDSMESRLSSDLFVEDEDKSSPASRERFSNNALYSISEALKTTDAADRGKIDHWLLKHFEEIKSWGKSYEMKDGWRDAISEYAFKNIISQTGNKELSRKTLAFCVDGGRLEQLSLSDLFHDNYSPDRKDGRFGIASFFAEKLGLNDSVVAKWQHSKVLKVKSKKGTEIFGESYTKNLEAAKSLEKARPGSARRLYDGFGIANFARYDEEMLLRQLEMAEQDTPYGVAAYPEADWNGAFFNNPSLGEAGKELLNGGFGTRIVEVASQFELARRLNGFNKKYGKGGHKIDFMFIAGHGTKDSVQLRERKAAPQIAPPPIPPAAGTSDEEYQKALAAWKLRLETSAAQKETLVSGDIKEGRGRGIRRAADEWFEEGAPVVFISCSTGIEGGIAQTAAKELGFNTVGPNKPTNIEAIDVRFDERGKPIFDVKYFAGKVDGAKNADVETMRYASGGFRG